MLRGDGHWLCILEFYGCKQAVRAQILDFDTDGKNGLFY